MDVTAAILPEAVIVSVTRYLAGTWSAGVYTPGAGATLPVTMMVQPLGPREVMRLPEGIRHKQLLKCHALAELRTAQPGASIGGDRFTWAGSVYEVIKVEDWSAFGGFWKAVAAHVEE